MLGLSGMKFLIVNMDYPKFLRSLYAKHAALEKRSYDEQMRVRMASLFGVADFYSRNLRTLGHDAWDVHANNEYMQRAWARENGITLSINPLRRFHIQRQRFPWLALTRNPRWMYEVLAAQVKHYRPDVLLNQTMVEIGCGFLKEVKPHIRLLVGQHPAISLSARNDFSCYDLVVSSFPPTIDYFREKGIPAELNQLAFEPNVLSFLANQEKTVDISFIGSFLRLHRNRIELLDAICRHFPMTRIWGPTIKDTPATSLIQSCYEGQAWGLDMYQKLRNSKITLNHHGDIPPYANNMRLFEATGVGTLLVTDWKQNLHQIFEPGKEVVAYRSAEECVELLRYYLENEEERETIASAGQRRTLGEHSYYQRMKELVEIVHKYA